MIPFYIFSHFSDIAWGVSSFNTYIVSDGKMHMQDSYQTESSQCW